MKIDKLLDKFYKTDSDNQMFIINQLNLWFFKAILRFILVYETII